MKLGVMLVSVFLSLILLSAFSSAANVMYIYEKSAKINQGFIDTLHEMGHDVSVVHVNSVPMNIAGYEMILVGNEKFKDYRKIPIENKNTLVANSYHGKDFGMTQNGGIGKMASNNPKVSVGNSLVQIYAEQPVRGKVAIPYYYMKNKHKTPGFESIVSTVTASSGSNYGDVVSYYDGVRRVCFFGIVESSHWTPVAKELFRDCVNFLLGAQAEPPICFVDNDCPVSEFSQNFCQNGNVQRNLTSYTCQPYGCVPSTQTQLVQICSSGCSNGQCLAQPPSPVCGNGELEQGEQCDDGNLENGDGCSSICVIEEEENDMVHDVALVNFSGSVDRIRLEKTDGTDILQGETFMCGESYRISVTVRNVGDFVENVSLVGGIGEEIDFDHNPIVNQAIGGSNLRTRTVNFSLGAGIYTLFVEAKIDGFFDSNPADNFAAREIEVVC